MKRNIEIIRAAAPVLEWAVSTLRQSADKPSGAEELIRGLSELLEEEGAPLMIAQSGTPDYPSESSKICCGALTIYGSARRVTRDDLEISLTPKEFDILYFLAKNRGEVFTKEQIYQAVWDEEYLLDDSNIMAFIRKIRKKIEPNPDAPQYILTIWGIGYKFRESL